MCVCRQILLAYRTDPKMEEMMRNMDFYVTPVLNVDGYIHSWKNESVGGASDHLTCAAPISSSCFMS